MTVAVDGAKEQYGKIRAYLEGHGLIGEWE